MQARLIPISDSSKFPEAGLPWRTVDQARWAFRKRHENGLAGAFVRIGRNVSINVPKFYELAGQNVA
jgi:hypothetical protein